MPFVIQVIVPHVFCAALTHVAFVSGISKSGQYGRGAKSLDSGSSIGVGGNSLFDSEQPLSFQSERGPGSRHDRPRPGQPKDEDEQGRWWRHERGGRALRRCHGRAREGMSPPAGEDAMGATGHGTSWGEEVMGMVATGRQSRGRLRL